MKRINIMHMIFKVDPVFKKIALFVRFADKPISINADKAKAIF